MAEPDFEAELARAALPALDADERTLLEALWRENLPRRATLRAVTFDALDPPLASPAPPGPEAVTGTWQPPATANGPLYTQSLAELAGLMARREASAEEVVEAFAARIETVDPLLRAFVEADIEGARAAARAADAARARGATPSPLAGIPLAVKDCIAVEGLALTGGSALLADQRARADAPVIAALRQAGLGILGKTAMHEFGAGAALSNGPRATGRNPWSPDRIPGGSSSGSAVAVAAGMAPAALGTDAAGSVRMPAGNCNLVGLKPSFGLIPAEGALPYCWSLDTIGVLTRTAEDAALLLEACLGAPARGRYTGLLSEGLKGRRIGVPRRYFYEGDDFRSDVRAAVEAALDTLRRLGAELVEVDLPGVEDNGSVYTALIAEAFAVHSGTLQGPRHRLGLWFRMHAAYGALVPAEDLLRAHRLRARLAAAIEAAMSGVDAVAIPGQAAPPTPFGSSFAPALTQPRSRFMRPWNVTGLPAIAVPCGFSVEGLPLSINFAGPRWSEATLLSLAYAYERETAFWRHRPDEARWRDGQVDPALPAA